MGNLDIPDPSHGGRGIYSYVIPVRIQGKASVSF
jgi:hypothetical protein